MKVFGVTIHFVDAGVDSGPVILQGAVELSGCQRARMEVLAALRPLEHGLLGRGGEAGRATDRLRADPQNPRGGQSDQGSRSLSLRVARG